MKPVSDKFNMLRNKKVFLRWFLSYLIIMGLVIVMSIMLYFYSYNIISQQAGKINHTLLEKAQIELDDYFMDARSSISSLLLDGDLQKAVKVNGEFSLGDREMLSNIHTNITNLYSTAGKFSHVFVYFPGGDTVLSENGHMNSQLFYDLYFQQEDLGKEDFVSWLGQEWTGDIQMVRNSKGEKEILILQSTFPRDKQAPSATLAVSISGPQLRRVMEKQQWDTSIELLMVSENGLVIGTDEFVQTIEDPADWARRVLSGRNQMELKDKSCQITTMPSTEQGFSYVILAPLESTRHSARQIQIFMVASLSVCILLGLVIAFILASINYRPLRRIMDLFGNYDRDGEVKRQNEYQWLTNRTIQFLDQHQDMQHHYKDSQRKLTGQYLYRLLTLPYDGEGKYARYLQQEQILQKPYNLVILFCFEQDFVNQTWEKDFDAELLQFIIVNIMDELAEGCFDVETVDVQDAIACIIVNSGRRDEGVREKLEGMFDQLQKFIHMKIMNMLSIACGSFCSGVEGVYQSYLTAREALEYLEKDKEQTIVWYEDIKNPYCLFRYNLETEQRIINTIKAGEGEDACKWVAQVINENYAQKEMLPSVRKCLLLDLLGTVLKGAQQGGSEEMVLDIAEGQKLFQRMDAEEAKEYFSEIIRRLCSDIQQKEKNNQSDMQFGKHVMEFVREHYQDPDLNVSITALHFGLTPSYLSALFKQQTGLSLLEYINNIRIDKVRELLEEGKSLTEICTLTGFSSSGALIRVFKKSYGITPGQMKKLNKSSSGSNGKAD